MNYGAFLSFQIDGEYKVVALDDMALLISSGEEAYFSHQGCDCCFNRTGKRLGSDVYDCQVRLTGVGLDGPDDYYEKQLCAMCLYEHEYGVGSFES